LFEKIRVVQTVEIFLAFFKIRILHAVNTHPTHAITPNNNCAELPENGRVTPDKMLR
jgi:hypothetical protein